MFDSLLIANRGEIAVRIARTARALGYRTIAVYSDADRDALHVSVCDDAMHLGPADPAQSYLHIERILAAAARSGAGAVHPGYGFLSENAAFARAVQEAGLVWVGPPPSAIEAMGDKARAKAAMQEAGVPCVPGYAGPDDEESLRAAAGEVGFPLLVKASAGGGGRGMRAVSELSGLAEALRSARAEAENAFGDGRLLLERYVQRGHHVEVQVLADQHGQVVHLFERDCSVQRRHQKVIEEAPCPILSPTLRARMGEWACAAARAVRYEGAGTVEFLVDGEDAYFLEMNTRLQVEHPVTEQVTGLDLVALQLSIAAGAPLPFVQDQLALRGHAIEARLYAEDPSDSYRPQPGALLAWTPPPGIRVDHGLRSPDTISASYDPMIAKLIASGPDRETARRRLLRALEELQLVGVTTNRAQLAAILSHPTFVAGQCTTRFLEEHPELALGSQPCPPALAIAAWMHAQTAVDGFRSAHGGARRRSFEVDGAQVQVQVEARDGRITVDGHAIRLLDGQVEVDGDREPIQVHRDGATVHVRTRAGASKVAAWVPRPASGAAHADGVVRMPMAGKVLALEVAVGEVVQLDQIVARVEAMKLETPLRAPVAGTVAELLLSVGDAAPTAAPVLIITPAEPTP